MSTRRRFLSNTAFGAAAALTIGGCTTPETEESTGAELEAPSFFKDTSGFITHGNTNLETRIEELGGFITPNDRFFVRNNSRSIDLDVNTYSLEITGDALEAPVVLSFQDLLRAQSRAVYSYIECGGNQRSFFGEAMGQPARGTQWGRGGVGMAIWTGVPLRALLEQAGVKDNAVDVQLIGMDLESPEGGFRRPMPIEKAMDEDTVLAYLMNGESLPRDHGFPVRAIVPGWVGSSNVKWLGRIEVSSTKVWSRNNTSSYVLIGDEYPAEGEASGKVATLQSIKSVLMLPLPAKLSVGAHRIRGYAYSPHSPIAHVAWSQDGGGTWQDARFIDPPIRYAWRRFEFEWTPEPGEQTLITKATDEAGNTQPDTIPFNEKGYLYNVPIVHPVQVG